MLTCFDFLSLACACTNLKLIDFPVQKFTYMPNIVPNPDSSYCSAYPPSSLPGMHSSQWADGVCSLLGEEPSL